MKLFKNLSVRLQLTLMIVLVTFITLTCGLGLFAYLDLQNFKDDLVQQMRTQVEIVGNASGAALAFGDEPTANEILSSLRLIPSVDSAVLYTATGKKLATFVRRGVPLDRDLSREKIVDLDVNPKYIDVGYDVTEGGEKVGRLQVRSNMGAYYFHEKRYYYLTFCFAASCIILATILGSMAQRSLSAPIIKLSAMVKRVASEPDYNPDLHSTSKNEIGDLIRGFAAMLSEVRQRQFDLEQSSEVLQETVSMLQEEVSEREAAEQRLRVSREELREFFIAAPIGIARLDADGHIVEANGAYLDVLDQPRELMIGQPIATGYSDEEEIKGIVEETLCGHTVIQREFNVYHADGSERIVRVSARGLYDGDHVVSIGWFIEDITQIRRAEHAEIERVERANRAKTEFLSRMSHELRTPMNSILGFGQLLEMTTMDEQQEECVVHILRAGRHLLNLINEVLDITKIETGNLSISMEGVSPVRAISEAIELVLPLANEKGITIHPIDFDDPALVIKADNQRLHQVIINLLSNAIKYNSKKGQVYCRVKSVDNDRIRIMIEDTGAGISPDRAERLFVPFDRMGAESSGVEGTGLGLAVTKSLVEAMHGKIFLDTEFEGPGSRFVIELANGAKGVHPSAAELADIADKLGHKAGPPRTIVLIEDNEENILLFQRVLGSDPRLTILIANHASEGLELIEERAPDLVILDMHLPDMDGLEVAKGIKNSPVMRRTPVLVVTADATAETSMKFQEIGIYAQMTKPIDVNMLVEMVDQMLYPEWEEDLSA